MKFLFRPIDIASLALFRIVFGILAFADIMGTWTYKHLYEHAFDPELFHFKYYGFSWVKAVSDPWMSVICIIILLATIGIMLGKWYRLSATIFALGFSYLFFVEKSFYLNHGYLTILLSWAMIFYPVDRAWSWRSFQQPLDRLRYVPYWPLFLLQFMMGVVYFFGGIAKINGDWLRAQPLQIWLRSKKDMPILGPLWEMEWVAWGMSYGGLLLDLLVVFFLLGRKTRLWALGFAVFFHTTNLIIFQIGIFPFLSVMLTLLYFPPDFPRRIGAWLSRRSWLKNRGWFKKVYTFLSSPSVDEKPIQYTTIQRRLITGLISAFAVLMLLLPLRHHLFPGPVAWTEEGHRYSWRMMLRSKRGYGNFTVKDSQTKEKWKIKPGTYLDRRQERKMYTHPDMILQFAHFLRDEYHRKGHPEVEVYANIRVKLNDGKYQNYIRSEVDLAKEEWHFFRSADWIVPLEKQEED